MARHRGLRLYGALLLMVLLSGVVFWVVGYLPWVLGGFALDAREAHGSADGLAGVRLAVPLLAVRLPELIACSLLGGVLAGIVPIAFPRVSRLFAVLLTACVVLAETTALLVASRGSLQRNASAQFAADPRVVQGLVLATVGAVVLGLAVGLAATVRHGVVAVAAGLAAAALPVWLGALSLPAPAAVLQGVAGAALLVGLVVSVHRTRWSAGWWPVALGLAWLGAPLAVAAGSVAHRLGPASVSGPGELVRGAAAAARPALSPAGQPWWPWAVAAVLALLWLARPADRREPAVLLAPDRGKHTATRRA